MLFSNGEKKFKKSRCNRIGKDLISKKSVKMNNKDINAWFGYYFTSKTIILFEKLIHFIKNNFKSH